MALAVAVALLTGSIAVPIAIRPFYYAQIVPLHLPEKSGLTVDEICRAYDEAMDYCTGEKDKFSAGILKYSKAGAAHFSDCRRLFLIDHWLFAAALSVIAAIMVYARKSRLPRLLGRSPEFWGAAGMGAALLTAVIFTAANFNRAFDLFHRILFPGKSNWVLNRTSDPIVRILPAEYFQNCAILSAAVAFAVIFAIVLADLKNSA